MSFKRSSDVPFYVTIAIWVIALLLQLAFVGTLIWAIIYVVTHMGGWLN